MNVTVNSQGAIRLGHTEVVANDSESGKPALAAGLPVGIFLSRLRAAAEYERAMRVFGGGWFLILALAGALKLVFVAKTMSTTSFSPTEWPALLSSLCLFIFYVALFCLILRRPPPAARSPRILPSVVAFIATYLPWTIVLFAPTAASPGLQLASAVLLLIGAILMVVVILHLGHSFSIVPQARTLVRSGPYAVVRHPLYFVEEIALLGTLLQCFSGVTLTLFLAHGALQIRRMFYEDDLLKNTFPDHGDYARSTARLIPYVW